MKQLGADELFLISEIADKMDIEIPEYPDMAGKTKKEQENLRNNFGLKVVAILIKRIHRAKDQVKDLVRTVTDKNPDEMTLKELINTFTSIMAQDGVMDFFK